MLVRLDSRELDKGTQASWSPSMQGGADAGELPDDPGQQGQHHGQRRGEVPAPGPALRGQDQGEELAGADRHHRRAARVDAASPRRSTGIITTWEAKKNLLGPPGRDRAGADLGRRDRRRVGAGGRRSRRRHGAGPRGPEQAREGDQGTARSKPGDTLPAYFVTATDPEHRYPGYVRRIASKAELVEKKHVVKVTVGFSDEVRKRLPQAEPGAAPRGRGPGADRLRESPAGLRPAPRRRPGLLRNRAVPLAVPAGLDRTAPSIARHRRRHSRASIAPRTTVLTRSRPGGSSMNVPEENRRSRRGVRRRPLGDHRGAAARRPAQKPTASRHRRRSSSTEATIEWIEKVRRRRAP